MGLNNAILSTLAYHSNFFYPLTFDELHRFLVINRPVSSNEVTEELNLLIKQKYVSYKKGLYQLTNRHPERSRGIQRSDLNIIRFRRRQSSLPKLRLAARAARLIGFLPWIKLVCVTGSLAMENSDPDDDIDLMIVTSQNRLWLARPLVIFLVSLFFVRRKPLSKGPTLPRQGRTLSESRPDFSNSICLNLWLDEAALKMENHRQDLRTAHELAQMKPVVNKDRTYERMLAKNSWGKKFLANAWKGLSLPRKDSPYNKRNNLFNLINSFLFRLQFAYMKPKITSEEVTLRSAFFHPKVRRTDHLYHR